MHATPSSDLSTQLDEARRLLAAGKHDDARTMLRTLRQEHQDSLETLALLLHALTIEFPPLRSLVDESSMLMSQVPEDMRQLLRFCRLLLQEGAPRTVEPLLEQRWMDLMRYTSINSIDVLPGSDQELMLESTTLLAESYMASGRGSSALDVVEEARIMAGLYEFNELFDRLKADFDPNDESVPAELHAVRRQVTKRYLVAMGQDEFSSTEQAMHFFGAFQAAWNEAMKDKPLPYGMMPREERDRFVNALFERIMEKPGDDDDAQPTEEELAMMRRLVKSSTELFDHPLFERNNVLKPFAPFFPDVVVTLGYPISVIDDFLNGATEEDIVGALKDCMDVMAHLLYMRMSGDETSYRQAFAAVWDIVREGLSIDEAHIAITGLCERADRLMKTVGLPTVRFIPGGTAQKSTGKKKSSPGPKGGGFMDKRRKKR